MKIEDPELQKIINERQNLARMESKNMISAEDFKEKDSPLFVRFWEIIRNYILKDKIKMEKIEQDLQLKKETLSKSVKYIKDQQNNKLKTFSGERNKMAEEKAAKVKAPKAPKAPKEVKEKKVTNAQLILKALQMKSVKDYDAVAARVVEEKPDADIKKVKSMAKVMVNEIIKGKGGKAKKYKWDATTFMLTLVE